MRTIIAVTAAFLVQAASAQTLPRKIATLVGLTPPQSYVHVFCDKGEAEADCAVTFRCHGYSEPVTWTVDVEPGLFKYYPGQTDGAGGTLDLETALVDAGLSERDARHRTACAVHSSDPVDVQAFSYLAGRLVRMSTTVAIGDPDAGPYPEDPHPLAPGPDPSSPDYVPPPRVFRADVELCGPHVPNTRCRGTYTVLVLFEWDTRYHTSYDLLRSTDSAGQQNLSSVAQDQRLSSLPQAESGAFTRIGYAEDPIPENGKTYYYWVTVSADFHGPQSEAVGPVEVEIPAQ